MESSRHQSRISTSRSHSQSSTCGSIHGSLMSQTQRKLMKESSSMAWHGWSAQNRRACVGHSLAPQAHCLHSVSQLVRRKHSTSSSTEKQHSSAHHQVGQFSSDQVLQRYSAPRELSTIQPHCFTGSSQKRLCCSDTQSHHVVSLTVSVMCLMLKPMETSKVQIQIKNQIWSSVFRFWSCSCSLGISSCISRLTGILRYPDNPYPLN